MSSPNKSTIENQKPITVPSAPLAANPMLPAAADAIGLLSLLAEFGGNIISSNDLHPDLIAQARASNRMYVDENSLGYIWEPSFAGRFPMTEYEVELFERCYPIEVELPSYLTFENLMKRMIKKGR